MQMNPTDLAHRAAQVVDTITEHGSAALDTAGRVAGDVGEVIVDAVDRVGRVLPKKTRRRWPIAPLAALALLAFGALALRRRRRAHEAVTTAADARRTGHTSPNGTPSKRTDSKRTDSERTEARAAGLA